MIEFLTYNWHRILILTGQHAWLVAASVGAAIVVGVPLGVLVTRFRWLSGAVLGLATVVLTIPSIALFGLMIPVLSVYGMGIGPAPAVAAVFLYSLLPIMRNTSLALQQIDPSIREAGIGIGMTFWQRLRLVELPLAVPVVLGGVRTAVVMNIGVMAIGAIVGAGGLGVLITQGISQSDTRQLVAGAVMVSLLAIVADTLLHRLQRVLTPKGIRTV
ncbi:ABC transporter permease [Pandoraea sp. XJJ-1]|uniref:ABC transporter permease n=1 Tax=Pandoraea cepalis TaxID=2508294 RepID=A0A5E4YQP0_9BURK|nr:MULTISPECIES: ABC transporter permease [Pandoraea]MBN9117289.1 ABC transporter permease [Pandoraea sp.]MDN4575341.1 ABC transporter permease [Pandoraea cepalis]MDN4579411.1 ABC transporter permease [Pandoraea cepalis]OJY19030.1 MAG: choline ABC transporter permease [Pandoraea sp. 64-18]WAL82342.1 ABC transporter permease [Pandoraea sp. XJJ-1]